MNYGYHYTPCNMSSSGPGMWLILKLAAVAGTVAGVWWMLKAIGRAIAGLVGAVAGAATAAAPIIFATVGAIIAAVAVMVVTVVVRNNQRPPMLPHDRPNRHGLEISTVEVIDVTPNRRRLNSPQPTYQPFASSHHAEVPR